MGRAKATVLWTLVAVAAAAVLPAGRAVLAADAAPPLRVGIAPNYPPLAFKEDGQLVGIEVDFAHKLGKQLGREVILVETPWDDLPKALIDDKTIDVVMSGTSITEKRKERVDFTDSYLQVGQMILIRDADYPKMRDVAAIDKPDVRVGFTSNTTSQQYAKQNLTKAQLQGFDDTEAGVAALRADKIDAFIADAPAVWRVAGGLLSKETQLRGLYTPLTQEQLAWAVRKGDTPLRLQLNAVIEKWKGDGTIDDVLDDWITVKKTTIEVKPHTPAAH
jgi:polar amino acid transport system substrate-binding protein